MIVTESGKNIRIDREDGQGPYSYPSAHLSYTFEPVVGSTVDEKVVIVKETHAPSPSIVGQCLVSELKSAAATLVVTTPADLQTDRALVMDYLDPIIG
jgi:hypothetical protein